MATTMSYGVNVNAPDKFLRTPLMRAATNGHIAVIQRLQHYGADVNAADEAQRTPLSRAKMSRHETIA